MTKRRTPFARRMETSALGLALLAIVTVHAWNVRDVPQGIFTDEAAIGLNAATIAESGIDEYGKRFPVYFDSFGDAKSPIFIYTAAGMFKLFGVSETALRMTSVLFFALTILALVLLARNAFPDNRWIPWYVLIASGFLPWLFPLSRVSFEVISQPAAIAWALFCTWTAFQGRRKPLLFAGLAGACWSLSVYSYATGRLLGFLFLGATLVVYARPRTWKPSLAMLGGFCVTMIPYALHALQNKGSLTGRFRGISYLWVNDLTLWEKITMFLKNYALHVSPEFLLFSGDPNLRHSTGFLGELFWTVALLAVLGCIGILLHRKKRTRFEVLMVLGALLSPVAVALTDESLPHALRSITLSVFALILSCYGWMFLWTHIGQRRALVASAIMVLLLVEATVYTRDYFMRYGPESHQYFHGWGMREAFSIAESKQPNEIVASENINYAVVRFFEPLHPTVKGKIRFARPELPEGACLISIHSDEQEIADNKIVAPPLNFGEATIQIRCR